MKTNKKLERREVKSGLPSVPERLRRYLPGPGEPVKIIDADGQEFPTHMHRSEKGRIDGLTDLHHWKHKTRPGDTVTISVSPNSPGIVKVRFRSQGVIAVPIDREVRDVFPDGSAVNEVLRALAPIMRRRRRGGRKTARH